MLGVRDNNEASWTQVLVCFEFMADATKLRSGDMIPVTGISTKRPPARAQIMSARYCRHLHRGQTVSKEQLIRQRTTAADVDEFRGRIKAGKDSQTDNDSQ